MASDPASAMKKWRSSCTHATCMGTVFQKWTAPAFNCMNIRSISCKLKCADLVGRKKWGSHRLKKASWLSSIGCFRLIFRGKTLPLPRVKSQRTLQIQPGQNRTTPQKWLRKKPIEESQLGVLFVLAQTLASLNTCFSKFQRVQLVLIHFLVFTVNFQGYILAFESPVLTFICLLNSGNLRYDCSFLVTLRPRIRHPTT